MTTAAGIRCIFVKIARSCEALGLNSMNKRILVIKHNYSGYDEDRSEFLKKATEADSLWKEVTEKEFDEIHKLIKENNKDFRYPQKNHSVYELIEYIDPKSLLTSLADELKLKAQKRLEQEKKSEERQRKRKLTLEAKKLAEEKARLEELKKKFGE